MDNLWAKSFEGMYSKQTTKAAPAMKIVEMKKVILDSFERPGSANARKSLRAIWATAI